ncbi:histidine phosphatase superfamily [Staphylotrichum tortipilum]|uniref:Histidine phosphatase superfamily n=1 Tax=Staphylotrichum tortipilum TaxID=2831512 RepID=A0AAN6RP20_9PEZI|nr:histidine phosphatase superfamily [Staphylotrichum longicolle]
MPTLHLVRHAQGTHNLTRANHAHPDPSLTPLGESQCAALASSFPHHAAITHLIASPLRRTLQTCLLSFKPVLELHPEMKVVALPEVQEISPLPCDVGSEVGVLEKEFGGTVDLGRVSEGWNVKTGGGRFAPVMGRLEERAREARVWLRRVGEEWERENPGREANIVVVTHGGFLHFLTQDWDGMNPEKGTGWGNTEWRSYGFVEEGEGDGEARLVEKPGSWRRRRGSEVGLTETEQMELRVATEGRLVEEWGGV